MFRRLLVIVGLCVLVLWPSRAEACTWVCPTRFHLEARASWWRDAHWNARRTDFVQRRFVETQRSGWWITLELEWTLARPRRRFP